MDKKQKTLQQKKDEEAFRKMKVIQIVNRMKRQVYLHFNRDMKAQSKSTEQKQHEKQTGQRRKLEILQRPKTNKPMPTQPPKKY